MARRLFHFAAVQGSSLSGGFVFDGWSFIDEAKERWMRRDTVMEAASSNLGAEVASYGSVMGHDLVRHQLGREFAYGGDAY